METELVTDTSFWVDLRDGDILFLPFQLSFKWITTDLVAELEFPKHIPDLAESLYTKGLDPKKLESVLVEQMGVLSQTKEAGRLSKPDLSCFVLARSRKATLITSDKPLKNFAELEGVEVHGTLWVLDLLVNGGVMAPRHAAQALIRMLEKGSYLPKEECEQRIKAWSHR